MVPTNGALPILGVTFIKCKEILRTSPSTFSHIGTYQKCMHERALTLRELCSILDKVKVCSGSQEG
jgi:hypothetical protein